MNITFSEYLNEELSMLSNRKLRDSIHDVISTLGPNDVIDVEELSNRLLIDHKITISPHFLDSFLDDFIKIKKGEDVSSILYRQDARWLGIKEKGDSKELKNNLFFQKPSLAKHKEKMVNDMKLAYLEKMYKNGMKDLEFDESVIRKTFILQHPTDAKRMMMEIYKVVIMMGKYDNSYENCWKMMMRMGNSQKLDKTRGFMKFAPKEAIDEDGRLNLNLKLGTGIAKKIEDNEVVVTPPSKNTRMATRRTNIKRGDIIIVRNYYTDKIFDVQALTDVENCKIKIQHYYATRKIIGTKKNGEIINVYWIDSKGAWYYNEDIIYPENKQQQDDPSLDKIDKLDGLTYGELVMPGEKINVKFKDSTVSVTINGHEKRITTQTGKYDSVVDVVYINNIKNCYHVVDGDYWEIF